MHKNSVKPSQEAIEDSIVKTSLSLDVASLEEWQLADGSVAISDSQNYLGVPVLVLEGSGDDTILRQTFGPDENAAVKTVLTMLPDVSAGGDPAFLDVALVLALVGFLATVALARFAERQVIRREEAEDAE